MRNNWWMGGGLQAPYDNIFRLTLYNNYLWVSMRDTEGVPWDAGDQVRVQYGESFMSPLVTIQQVYDYVGNGSEFSEAFMLRLRTLWGWDSSHTVQQISGEWAIRWQQFTPYDDLYWARVYNVNGVQRVVSY